VTRHPPPILVAPVGWCGRRGLRRIDRGSQGSLETVERLGEPPLAGEGPSEPGEIASRRRPANVYIGETRLDVAE
jgi:hypothetical protein